MAGTITVEIDGKKINVDWLEDRDPTPKDYAYIEQQARKQFAIPESKPVQGPPSPPSMGMGAGLAAERADAAARQARQSPANVLAKLNAMPQAQAPMSPQVMAMAQKRSAEKQPPKPRTMNAAQMREAANQMQRKVESGIHQAISPIVDNPIYNMVAAPFGGNVTKGIGEGLIAGAVTAPVNLTAEAVSAASDPNPTVRAGAAANLALNLLPIDAIFGKAIKGGLSVAAKMLKVKGATPEIEAAIAESIKAGAHPQDVAAGLGGTPQAAQAVSDVVAKSRERLQQMMAESAPGTMDAPLLTGNERLGLQDMAREQGKEIPTYEETQTGNRTTVQSPIIGTESQGSVQPGRIGGDNRTQEVRSVQNGGDGSQGAKEEVAKGMRGTEPPQPLENVTGLANRVLEAEGLTAEKGRVTPKGESHAVGKKMVDEGFDYERLAREIAQGKRVPTDIESGALLEGKRRLKQAVNVTRSDLHKAAEGSAEQRLAAQEYEAAKAKLQEYVDNVQKGKTEWSNTGRSWQEGTTLDYGDYADVLTEATLYKKSITPKDEAFLKSKSDAIRTLDEQSARLESGLDADLEAVMKATQKDKRFITDEEYQAQKQAIRDKYNRRKGNASRQAGAWTAPEDVAYLAELAWLEVKRGASKLEDVVRAVQEMAPGSTAREIRNAMAGNYKKATISEEVAAARRLRQDFKARASATNELEDLQAGKVRTPKDKISQSDELKAIRAQIAELKKVKGTEAQVKELEAQLKTGNLPPKVVKTPAQVSQELEAIRFQRDQLKKQVDKMIKSREPKGIFEKPLDWVSATREPVASGDNSFSFNQGAMALMTDPSAWAKGFAASMKSGTERGLYNTMESLKQHPRYAAAERYGLFEQGLNDQFGGGMMKNVPIIGQGERMYEANGPALRLNMFDNWMKMAEAMSKDGTVSPEVAKRLATEIKTITGQGLLKGKPVEWIGKPFMALRYAASNVETSLGLPLLRAINEASKTGDYTAAKVIGRKYLRAYTGYLGLLAGAEYALGGFRGHDKNRKAKIDLSPTSTDFGRLILKRGSTTTTIDLLPPQMQALGKLIQVGGAVKQAASGRTVKGLGAQTEVLGEQLLYKANPAIGTALAYSRAQQKRDKKDFGKVYDIKGHPMETAGTIGSKFLPISIQGAIETWGDKNDLTPAEKALLTAGSLFIRTNVRSNKR